jgi:hypothetical protein
VLNTHALTALKNAHFDGEFIRPLYESYSFARLPQTLIDLFQGGLSPQALPADVFPAGTLPRKVALLLIDALGWRFIQPRLATHPALRAFADSGVVSVLTSQFPSTTSAHITTIHSGLPVYETGVFEWTYWEPLIGRMFLPLRFKTARPAVREEEIPMERLPQLIPLIPPETTFSRLKALGVESHVYQIESATGVYNEFIFRGASVYPYAMIEDGLRQLAATMQQASTPTYSFLYYDFIDALCHLIGPEAPELQTAIDDVLNAIHREVVQPLIGTDTLLLITADHGQIGIEPDKLLYLDAPELAPLQDWLLTDSNGEPRLYGGSCRDGFLYVREDKVDQAAALLQSQFGDAVAVYRTEDLIAAGIFGTPSTRLRERLSSLVVLPRGNNAIWWQADEEFAAKGYRGFHGGLSREEMEIPLLARVL